MKRMRGWIGFGIVLLAAGQAQAQGFQLVVAITPPGSGSSGQEVRRYNVAGTGGAMTQLSDIPASQMNDPAGLVFRTPSQLFVANRHGNSGVGSVGQFNFDGSFNSFTQGPTTTGNGLANATGITIDNANDEMFVVNAFQGTVSRFLVDAMGNTTANGTLSLPNDARGVVASEDGDELFVSVPGSQTILRYARTGGGFSAMTSITLTGAAANPHLMKFREGELYIGDISGSVRRIAFDGAGNAVQKASIASHSPIDMAFSPDGMEMFVSNHFAGGGITRYLYNSGTDTWGFTGSIATPSLGGIATTYGAVPEPATLLALGAGLAGLARRRARKR